MTLAQLTASIAHEVGSRSRGGDKRRCCLRWLDSQPPDLDEARQAAREMIKDGNRITRWSSGFAPSSKEPLRGRSR